jgi:hypothetical protein
MTNDRRIDGLAERLSEELVDAAGKPADGAHVAEVVQHAAERLADAPIQDFVPLLVENEARDELRHEGLHRTLPDDPTGPLHDPEEGTANSGDMPSARY